MYLVKDLSAHAQALTLLQRNNETSMPSQAHESTEEKARLKEASCIGYF